MTHQKKSESMEPAIKVNQAPDDSNSRVRNSRNNNPLDLNSP